MTQKEKLIELLNQYRECYYDEEIDCNDCDYKDVGKCCIETRLADYLFANGGDVLPCKVGDTVWVVERDEYGDPCEVSGYIFLASCLDYVIVSLSIDDSDDIRYIVEYHAKKTAEDYEAGLSVFRAEDCYVTKEEAEAAWMQS